MENECIEGLWDIWDGENWESESVWNVNKEFRKKEFSVLCPLFLSQANVSGATIIYKSYLFLYMYTP